jgi:pimeloyl-ACP methyl ester carboxylesterase
MPFAGNGVRIYYEVEGSGPPLVLQHGFAGSLGIWRMDGYVDALKHAYQCVLIDARGHGRSDKPKSVSAYGLEPSYGDVLAVLNHAGIEQAHYWGYSMGGAIGLFAANTGHHGLLSIVIGGSAPGPPVKPSARARVA